MSKINEYGLYFVTMHSLAKLTANVNLSLYQV